MEKLIKKLADEYRKKGCFYRTIRTFAQAFAGVFSAYLVQIVTHEVELSYAVAVALSTALAGLMNKDNGGNDNGKNEG